MSQERTFQRRVVDGLSILIVLIAMGVIGRAYLQGRSSGHGGYPVTGELDTDEWFYELAGTGNRIGQRDAPVTVVVFSSYYRCIPVESTPLKTGIGINQLSSCTFLTGKGICGRFSSWIGTLP